jgi:predicted transcriptional regulator
MIDRRLIGIASDPHRRDALTLLNERTASAGEVAAALEIEPSEADRLLEQMYADGLIEMVGETLDRGAVEPSYKALVHTLWDVEELEALGLDEERKMVAWIIRMVESDIREAVESGTLFGRRDSHLSRAVSTVDEQGWDELRRIFADALEAVFAVEAASVERLAERGEEGFPVLSAMFLGELPPRTG